MNPTIRYPNRYGDNHADNIPSVDVSLYAWDWKDADVQRVMLRLSREYPGDLGMLMPLMLNLLQLKPGQAFFMTVDEPHAYLRGDILEVRMSF